MKREEVHPTTYITQRLFFDLVKDGFEGWLNPVNGVINAMVERLDQFQFLK